MVIEQNKNITNSLMKNNKQKKCFGLSPVQQFFPAVSKSGWGSFW